MINILVVFCLISFSREIQLSFSFESKSIIKTEKKVLESFLVLFSKKFIVDLIELIEKTLKSFSKQVSILIYHFYLLPRERLSNFSFYLKEKF